MKLRPKPWKTPKSRRYHKHASYGAPKRVRNASTARLARATRRVKQYVGARMFSLGSPLAQAIFREYMTCEIQDAERKAGWPV
jgi:hypothetical protein